MKNFIFLSCIALFAFLSCSEKPTESKNIKTEIAKKLPTDYMFMQRAYPKGEIKPNAQRQAAIWRKDQVQNTRNQANLFEFAGPLNIGGRITDIEIVSGTANTVYVGAASGGVFKSTDSGDTWQPIFDDQPMLAIGDIAVSESNSDIIVVGTGEPNAGGGSLAYDGDGVYISENAGMTWQNIGLQEVGSIGKVLIHPSNPDIIIVGAMGSLFRNDSNRGIYKTTDGGTTWNQVLFVADNTGIIDMSIHPTNPDIVYAASWQRERTPENRTYGGDASNIYRSTDGGETWSILTNGLPTEGGLKGRISIDISSSNPEILYASYADASGNIQGIYKTENGGDSWMTKNSSQLTNVGFHWWFGGLFVNPQNPDEVYHSGFRMQKTTDGADSWQSTFPNVHVDQHALAFDATNPATVFVGNDGGLYKSANSGDTSELDITLPITQFYRMYVDPSNPDKIYGGTQDNSTMRTTTSGLSDWTIITGGDGFQPLVDKDNTNVIYALSQFGNLIRSTDDAVSFVSVLNGIPNADRRNWDTPIAFDPQDNQTLFYGTQRVYKSTDMAASWTAISPDLTNGSSSGNLTYGTITTIDVSPLDSDIIYIGTDDGNVWQTTDGGANWISISATLPNRWVTRVQASPNTLNEVYVTFSGYRYGEDDGHVFKSTDNGTNWTDLSNAIPDIPVSDIEIDPFDNLFLATDIGVLSSNDGGNTWLPFGENVPSLIVTDLHFDENSGFLFVATYGRSIYKINISEDVLATDAFEDPIVEVLIYPNPAQNEISIGLNGTISSGNIRIFNQLGQQQLQTEISVNNPYVDIRNLATGMYILQIETGERTYTQKFIKK
ncbi:T9SS type A sorting domain-containing protein [uncultured Dokdonia sp.]|uniref:VPS10 domain-containing protein n=1 Tax=uncultured Dokdonia sp. TaxID=575653 RepID=UPI00262FE015|nr:T9SS type A sorting domain-containing protein [uncultured Dokdonia sp.]